MNPFARMLDGQARRGPVKMGEEPAAAVTRVCGDVKALGRVWEGCSNHGNSKCRGPE